MVLFGSILIPPVLLIAGSAPTHPWAPRGLESRTIAVCGLGTPLGSFEDAKQHPWVSAFNAWLSETVHGGGTGYVSLGLMASRPGCFDTERKRTMSHD